MGYISKNDKIKLTAFYTQKGRTFYLNGDETDKKPVFFSLGDSDTNYIIGVNNQTNTVVNNILKSGFIPDLSGDYDGCLKGVAEGVKINNLINYTPSGNTDYKEVRFFTDNHPYDGLNNLNIKIDLSKYIGWLKYYGNYSVNTNDSYNKIEQTLTSPFIKLYNYLGVFNTTNNSISTSENIKFTFSEGDYKNYEKFNRFLLDTSFSSNFKTVVPSNGYQSSPLTFLFTSKNNLGNNGGNTGIIINNRDYVYLVKNYTTNVTTTYSYNTFNSGVALDTTVTYDITPAVIIRYYKNNNIIEETFKLRPNSNIINGNLTNSNNQYLKLFVNDLNKTLITREAELLEEFIINRTDLFTVNNNGLYNSRPLTIYCDTNDGSDINFGTLKISFVYNSHSIYSPIPNDTFII